MKNKVLLIVDVQNDFCAKSGKFDKIKENYSHKRKQKKE